MGLLPNSFRNQYILIIVDYFVAIKFLNFELEKASEQRRLQLNELDKFRRDAYEKAKMYKENKSIPRSSDRAQIIYVGLESSCIQLKVTFISGKFEIMMEWNVHCMDMYHRNAIDIENPRKGNTFKVNEQILKPLF